MAEYAPVDLAAERRVEFELNGREVIAPPGTMLADAAFAHGVEVPIFCYEHRLGSPIGACRMCLVHVEGMRGLQTACSTAVQEDMVVRTETDEVRDAQDGVLELLLANHPLDCPVCDKGGECPLQDLTFKFGPGETRFVERKRHFPKPLDLSSQIALDRERCITCFRCVRFSQEVAEDGHLIMRERGAETEIATFTGDAYTGRFTGNVIDLCPVGALTSIPYRFVARPWDIRNAPSVCGECPVGCNLELTERDGNIARVTGRPEPNYEVEEGWLCDKARWAYPADRASDRPSVAVIKDGDSSRAASLSEAVEAAALLLGQPGPHAIVIGGSATVEEAYLAQELAAGSLPGAAVARVGIPDSPTLGALRAAPTAQLGDIDGADTVIVIGGDPANQHPVVELRVRKAIRRGAAFGVAGPRPHALTRTGQVAITRSGKLVDGVRAMVPLIREATRAIVLWDEADLAAETDAAAELAATLARHPTAAHIELSADVNSAGLRALGIRAEGVLEALEAGDVGTLLTIRTDPTAGAGGQRWARAMGSAKTVVAVASHVDELPAAAIVLPAFTHREQEGVLVSMARRAQRLRPGAAGPAGAAPGWELLLALAHRLGAPPPERTPASLFAAAAAARPGLAGLDYDAIGTLGATLPAPAAPTLSGPAAPRAMAGSGLPLVATTRIFGDAVSHRSDALAGVRQSAELGVSEAEAERLGLRDGARARLRGPDAECVLAVRIDPALPDGAAFATTGVPASGVDRLLPVDRGPVRVEVSAA